jgi:hypothetical protein
VSRKLFRHSTNAYVGDFFVREWKPIAAALTLEAGPVGGGARGRRAPAAENPRPRPHAKPAAMLTARRLKTPHVHVTALTRASLLASPRLGLARDDACDACVPGAPCYTPLARPAAWRAASPHRRPRRGRVVALVHACMRGSNKC